MPPFWCGVWFRWVGRGWWRRRDGSAGDLLLHRPRAAQSAIAVQLADVVHQAIEQPLGVDLALAAQAEAPEFVRATDVGKHRLHGAEPAAVLIAPMFGVDLALHFGRIGFGEVFRSTGEEHHLSHGGAFGMAQAVRAQRAGSTHALRSRELHRFARSFSYSS